MWIYKIRDTLLQFLKGSSCVFKYVDFMYLVFPFEVKGASIKDFLITINTYNNIVFELNFYLLFGFSENSYYSYLFYFISEEADREIF